MIRIAILCMSMLLLTCGPGEKFNNTIWKAQDKLLEGNPREKMVHDLIENQLLIGKTQEEIVELLGKDLSNEENTDTSKIYYTVSEKSGHPPITSHGITYLVITMNSNGLATDVQMEIEKFDE